MRTAPSRRTPPARGVGRRPSRRQFLAGFIVLLAVEVLVLQSLDPLFPSARRSAQVAPPGAAPGADAGADAGARPVGAPVPTETAGPTDTPAPTDTPSPTETPGPTVTPGPEASLPVVPVIDQAMKDRLRVVFDAGRARGNRPEVFAKVGDSITVSGYFLTDIGCGRLDPGDHGDLAATVEYFRAVQLPTEGSVARCADGNAFTRRSLASGIGWTALHVFALLPEPPPECVPPLDTALACELELTKPSTALVLFGTNEVHSGGSAAAFEVALDRVTTELLAAGVIPVLSTIPPRGAHRGGQPRLGAHNAAVIAVAAREGVPLWNYWRAFHDGDLVGGGLEVDGIHPNAFRYGTSLSATGLRYGYNQRNLGALQVLDKLRRIVFEDGPADSAGAAP